MFASRSSIQVHKLDSFRIKQSWKIPSSSASAVFPSVTEIHHAGPIQSSPNKTIKICNKDVRSSAANVLLCRSALIDLHYWLTYKSNLHGFETHGHFAAEGLPGRVWQSMHFLSHKTPRLTPLCDGHLLHLLFCIIHISWTKSII